jgi:ubiquinone/menaquinone biosynthesis C-methylase UbiE
MTDWYDIDEFWDVMSHKLFVEKNPAETKKEIDQMISLTGISPNSKILDLCCGLGRHSLELAKRGFEVTGVDRTVQYLDKAKGKASEKDLSIEFIKDDMRNFKRSNYFNTIIIMYTSFGYFEDQNENIKVLHNSFSSLKKKGLLLIDVVGKEILQRKFTERESFELDGITYVEERKVFNNWSRIENRWIMLKDNLQKEFKLSHWVYSENEIKEMLNNAGFSSVKIFGDLAGKEYDENAERLIAIAVK